MVYGRSMHCTTVHIGVLLTDCALFTCAGVGRSQLRVEEKHHGIEPLGAGPGRYPDLPVQRVLSDHQGNAIHQYTQLHIPVTHL